MTSGICLQQPCTSAALPSPAVRATAIAMTLWCLGFAGVNVALALTGHLSRGDLAGYAGGLEVENWLAVALKVLGAAVALLAVSAPRQFPSVGAVTVMVWGAFATLGVYAAGAVLEAVAMLLGLIGGADRIDALSVGYVLFFIAGAAGFGVLGVSWSRRHAQRRSRAALGLVAAPLVLGTLLVGVPALLTAVGVMPRT
ncbi:hypothetical protein [Nocardioides sp. KR10-350]|uniref:hypothetical protein n=1 Tax=Nocardioides cheoyonin TaxID=3156615 RepID=UPI0032B49BB2